MGSLEELYPLPCVSYADLLHNDKETRAQSVSELIKSLNSFGACRVSDHGIPQEVIDRCFEKVSEDPKS